MYFGQILIMAVGTTGKPKGVMVSHSNVVNRKFSLLPTSVHELTIPVLSMAPGNLHIEPGVKVAQLLNIGFDMCAWETLSCLMNGGTLYLRGPRRADWIKVLKTVDVVVATPSILLPHNPNDFPNVRVVATAGEPCPQSLADKWASQATFYNSCGPTEVCYLLCQCRSQLTWYTFKITIVNTMHKHVPNTPLSIGKPTANNTVYILDEYLRPVPFGAPGVMWAGGKGVSKGYLGLDELTAKRFLPDPYVSDGGYVRSPFLCHFLKSFSRMYNTGDIGKWREDGSLDHLGRVDDQVKIKVRRRLFPEHLYPTNRSVGIPC